MVKNPPVRQETRIQSLGWEDPLEKEMATHTGILAWEKKSHGQRSLAGYSPWGCKELDMTEHEHHFMTSKANFHLCFVELDF